jgi:hypothetical protein
MLYISTVIVVAGIYIDRYVLIWNDILDWLMEEISY